MGAGWCFRREWQRFHARGEVRVGLSRRRRVAKKCVQCGSMRPVRSVVARLRAGCSFCVVGNVLSMVAFVRGAPVQTLVIGGGGALVFTSLFTCPTVCEGFTSICSWDIGGASVYDTGG